MRRLLSLVVLVAAAAFFVPPASAHVAYCGHGNRYYNGGYSKADYRYYSNSNGNHYHTYYHWNLAPNGRWLFQHSYYRKCNAWA